MSEELGERGDGERWRRRRRGNRELQEQVQEMLLQGQYRAHHNYSNLKPQPYNTNRCEQ